MICFTFQICILGMVKDENLYGVKLVQIPAPQFVIFYNGMKEMPDRTVLRLSDAYSVKEENPALELTAVMLNITWDIMKN